MRAIVAIDHRFLRGTDGRIYSTGGCGYEFWKRYLQVFDEVVVFARVKKTDDVSGKLPAEGNNVRFVPAPHFLGPWEYLSQSRKLRSVAETVSQMKGAFIIRCPGTVSTALWKQLKKKGIPYGVEVVGSSYDSLKTANINPMIESLLFLWQLIAQSQKRQCAGACAAAYVTQQYLQEIYPPGGWSTYYSSIDLLPDAFVTDEQMAEKMNRLQEPFEHKRPFQICHAASMDARYKAQDVLIRAVAACRKQEINVELFFLGDGKYRGYYESIAQQEGIAPYVKFHGRVTSGKPVRDLMDQADLSVLPSLTEGLPRSLIEAMARGLPCVASSVGGIPELLDDVFLVPAGKVVQLTKKLTELLRSPERLLEASTKNRLKAREYSASILNQRRVAFYQKLT